MLIAFDRTASRMLCACKNAPCRGVGASLRLVNQSFVFEVSSTSVAWPLRPALRASFQHRISHVDVEAMQRLLCPRAMAGCGRMLGVQRPVIVLSTVKVRRLSVVCSGRPDARPMKSAGLPDDARARKPIGKKSGLIVTRLHVCSKPYSFLTPLHLCLKHVRISTHKMPNIEHPTIKGNYVSLCHDNFC